MVVHGHEFHRSDAEAAQMLDRWLGGKPCIGAAQIFWDFRMELREAFHVEFIDDRIVPCGARGWASIPIKGDLAHSPERSKRTAIQKGIADGGMPLQFPSDAFSIWVEQEFAGIEAMSGSGIIRTINPVAIDLIQFREGNLAMPDLIGFFRQGNACDLVRGVRSIKEAEIDAGRILGKECKVDSLPVWSRSKRSRTSWPNSVAIHSMLNS